MHKRGVVHRDLKPENILLSCNKNEPECEVGAYIADFGFSRNQETMENEKIVAGTIGYFAPETLKYGTSSSKSDIFSVGCLLYYLITGKQIFASNS